MKKIMFLVILGILLSVGCSKESTEPDGLDGTVWVWSVDNETLTFSFTSSTNFTADYVATGIGSDSYSGTYIYSHPNITFNIAGDTSTTATINGNTMTISSDDGETALFTKQ